MHTNSLPALPLSYARPGTAPRHRGFVAGLALFGAIGMVVNLALAGLAVHQAQMAWWVYHDLMQDPRAFGRVIAPETIASLRDRTNLMTAFGGWLFASIFGLLLSIHLLAATILWNRRPVAAVAKLRQYRLCKPVGIVLTAAALLWAGNESGNYWIAATRHIPQRRSFEPYPELVYFFGAMLPWWWIGKDVRGMWVREDRRLR